VRGAQRAEQAGYESIWVSDHLVVPESGGRLPPIEILEPIATLAYVAAVTNRIKLATSVIVVPYRNAIHLAKELATLDRLSSGRVIAGVASGWLEAEFRALGVSFEKRGAYTVPHSQRSKARVTLEEVEGRKIWIEDIHALCLRALQTETQVMVKREDEQAFAELNGAYLKFVEDAARLLYQVFDADKRIADFRIACSHLESLHSHDAVSVIANSRCFIRISFVVMMVGPSFYRSLTRIG